jgi:hypothetical protein
MQHISLLSLQQISSLGKHPNAFGITKTTDLLRLMTYLKELAFQSGMKEAFVLAVIFFAMALLLTLFVTKKQTSNGSKDKYSAAAEF